MSSLIIYSYVTSSGKVPFDDWIEDLDGETESKIRNRLNRIRLGNFGDCKSIKDSGGISELRIDYGPGYRVYIGRYKTTLVVLLMGGDKGSQTKDITKAKKYWADFKERNNA